MTDDGDAHLTERQLIGLLAALEVAREAVTVLTSELIAYSDDLSLSPDAHAAQRTFRFVDEGAFLGDGGQIIYPRGGEGPTPCLEPLAPDERDRLSGNVCGELPTSWCGALAGTRKATSSRTRFARSTPASGGLLAESAASNEWAQDAHPCPNLPKTTGIRPNLEGAGWAATRLN